MKAAKEGWLVQLLGEALAHHQPDQVLALLGPELATFSPRARARTYLRKVMRASGLAFGTPTPSTADAKGETSSEEALFRAVVLSFARIALDIATVVGAPSGRRAEQLLVLFSTLAGDLDDVEQLLHQLQRPGAGIVSRRLWSKVETALTHRVLTLSGDPMYGLVLHNGAVYADAQAFAHQAVELFHTGLLHAETARRRLIFAGKQKALLVEVLTALVSAERKPAFSSRKAILQQIDDLHLPSDVETRLRARVRRSFDRPPSLAAIVQDVRSKDMRRFIIEQTLLCSLVDGRRSTRELAFIHELAHLMSLTPDALKTIEMEMAEYYAKNRSVVDVFTVAQGAEVMGEELVETMQLQLERNFQRLMREVRETGELSVLLAKAARGITLTSDERQRMRAQLIDVAKAIPALAIFAAPGGVLLLMALAKVLPFSMLPSAFQDEDPEDTLSGRVARTRR
jgi:hypothetical protein